MQLWAPVALLAVLMATALGAADASCTLAPCGPGTVCHELNATNTGAVAQGRVCECAPGFFKPSQSGVCEPIDYCDGPCIVQDTRHGSRGGAEPWAAAGWRLDGVPFSNVTTCGSYGRVLGGFGQATAGSVLSRQFDNLPAHADLYIKATVLAIDQWENESFVLVVDGAPYPVLPSGIDTASLSHGANECGLATKEAGAYSLSVHVPHSASSVVVSVQTTPNLGASSESWGLLDFHLELHQPGPCHSCAANAVCSSGPAGAECTCGPSLVGDGSSCESAEACSARCSPFATCNATGSCTCNSQYTGDGLSCTPGVCLMVLEQSFGPSRPAVGWYIRETSAMVERLTDCPDDVLGGVPAGATLTSVFVPLSTHTHAQISLKFVVSGHWRGEQLSIYADGTRVALSDPIAVAPNATDPCGQTIDGQTVMTLRSPFFEHSGFILSLKLYASVVKDAFGNPLGSVNNTWGVVGVQALLDGVQGQCGDLQEVCAGADASSYSCECRPGYAGSPCQDVDECAAPACARHEIVDTFSVDDPFPNPDWPDAIVSTCGHLPPYLVGARLLSSQTLNKTFTALPSHSTLSIHLQFVIVDSEYTSTVMQAYVDGRLAGQTPLELTYTGTHICGSSNFLDGGLIDLTLPEMPHTGSTLQLSLIATSVSHASWGLARATITLDPSANPGCNECSKPHMVCTNTPGSSSCACEAGYELVGNTCLEIDECALQEEVTVIRVPAITGRSTWTNHGHPGLPVIATGCDGYTVTGIPGWLDKFAHLTTSFDNLPSHTSVDISVMIYVFEPSDSGSIAIYADRRLVLTSPLKAPEGALIVCGTIKPGKGRLGLYGTVPVHTARSLLLSVTAKSFPVGSTSSFGIVWVHITLKNEPCLPGEQCTNTIGSHNCTCEGDSVYTEDHSSCVDGVCPALNRSTHNGFTLSACAEGHAVQSPSCTVACVGSIGSTAETWGCAPGGMWEPTYPLCIDYEPARNATAGATYVGPPVRTSLDMSTATGLLAQVSSPDLDPDDTLTVSNDPADFGSITAFFSSTVDRAGTPVRVRLNVSHTDGLGVTRDLEVPEFEIDISTPLSSSGSTQFAPAGQAFVGQEPEINGGKAPYSFGLSAGRLPTGLTINSRGTIVGTPVDVGSFPGVVVQVTDANGAAITLEPINFRVVPALEVTSNASGVLPTAVAGIEYFQPFNFTATGGSGAVTFEAVGNIPAGLDVDTETGALTGFLLPSSARAEPYLFDIVAIDGSGIQAVALVVSLVVEARPDCDDPGNGPNGQGCGTGLCVDMVALDGAFTCECNATGLGGDNCQLVDGGGELAASRGATGVSSAVFGTIGALAALLLIVLVVVVLVRRAQVRARNQPFDFQAELERMREEGLIVLFGGEGEDGMPREIKRGNIQLLDKLGAGQFGDVFKGTVDDSAATGIPAYLVAVKTLKGNPTSQEMTELMREAALMAQFRHRNVVNLVGVCTKGEPYYLVVQFCENGSLADYLKAQPEPLGEAVMMKMAHDIATGMEYLSGAGLVHRDLAARNVLLDSQVVCKVADFGMSRDVATTNKEYYRSGKDGIMAVRWAAPEALDEQVFSQKSDVWAWGITVYEILTGGATPYDTWTNSKVWVSVKAGFRLECPPEVDEEFFNGVIAPCWHEDPGLRPTFSQLRKQLENAPAMFTGEKAVTQGQPAPTSATNHYLTGTELLPSSPGRYAFRFDVAVPDEDTTEEPAHGQASAPTAQDAMAPPLKPELPAQYIAVGKDVEEGDARAQVDTPPGADGIQRTRSSTQLSIGPGDNDGFGQEDAFVASPGEPILTAVLSMRGADGVADLAPSAGGLPGTTDT